MRLPARATTGQATWALCWWTRSLRAAPRRGAPRRGGTSHHHDVDPEPRRAPQGQDRHDGVVLRPPSAAEHGDLGAAPCPRLQPEPPHEVQVRVGSMGSGRSWNPFCYRTIAATSLPRYWHPRPHLGDLGRLPRPREGRFHQAGDGAGQAAAICAVLLHAALYGRGIHAFEAEGPDGGGSQVGKEEQAEAAAV